MVLVMRLGAEQASCAHVVHVDVAVGLHPVFVGLDGQRPDQAQAAALG